MAATHTQLPMSSNAWQHRNPMQSTVRHPIPDRAARLYRLTAVMMPAGDNVDERPVLTLQRYQPLIDYIAQRMKDPTHSLRSPAQLDEDAASLSQRYGLSLNQVRRMLPSDVRQPHGWLRPFVVRAVRGEWIELHIANHTLQPLEIALLDDDYGIQQEGAQQMLAPGETGVYRWHCKETGIFPIFNKSCLSNARPRSLLGVLMIEP
ncbi:MAG: hypothetical protein NZ553_10135 [Caldilinea sp.]|nr:hypothetical protein [Caldilinea sp.]MDW8440821.1 hypothetical protein [Caldilineaceae bacterium]